jgi:ABC-2 type transport system ATP-binding protein
LDEPANGLDPQARIEMRELLLHLASLGKTLIVTSHILPELSRICDTVAIITKGKLRAFGALDTIMRQISQERTIEVQLAAANQAKAAMDAIRPLIEDGADLNASETEATVRFRTAKPEEELGAILTKLVQSGVRVTQFRELQTDLEEAFLSVTRADAQPKQRRPGGPKGTIVRGQKP